MAKIGNLVLGNIVGFPHPERLVALFLLLWAGLLSLLVVLVALGLDTKPATYGVFVASTGFLHLGGMVRQRGLGFTLLVLLALVLLTFWLTSREQMSSLIDGLLVAVAVALLSGMVIAGVQSIGEHGSSTLEPPMAIDVSLRVTPNLWVVVTDGYPSSTTLKRDLNIELSDQLSKSLQEMGFATPRGSWSGYASTRLAIPSIFEMDYIATDWQENLATIGNLYAKIGGQNQLFEILENSGYQLHMIEAGWSGGGCGAHVDVCIPSKINDGALNLLLYDSILSEFPWASPGYHFALGNQATMAKLLDLANRTVRPEAPIFVFAHLIAPHPPLFLNEGCELVVEESRKGFFYPYPDVDAAERDRLFKEQLRCVDSFLLELAAEVSDDDVLIIVSDHGPARRAQVSVEPSKWSDAALRERMGTLVSVRTPMVCNLPEPYITVNLMRSVLSCMADTELALLEPRLFPGPGIELDPLRVERLLRLGENG